MPDVCKLLGGELLFHGIEMKPGGWAMAMLVEGKVVICLSGNPFAASATFELLAAPYLRKISGEKMPFTYRVRGMLRDPFPKESRGRRFVRARMEGIDVFLPKNHDSAALSSMTGCNCLVDIPAGTCPLREGTMVQAVWMENVPFAGGSIGWKWILPPAVAVSGVKNSGKTTMLEQIIPRLRERGLRVAVIKHDVHSFVPDVPGTDSDRLRRAGAEGVAVFSPERYMLTTEHLDTTLEEMLTCFPDVDIVLIEGAKQSDLPKIELVRSTVLQ